LCLLYQSPSVSLYKYVRQLAVSRPGSPLVGGLRSGMGYCGARGIGEMQRKARFMPVSSAGLRESHVHDVVITKEAPNCRVE